MKLYWRYKKNVKWTFKAVKADDLAMTAYARAVHLEEEE